MDKMRGWGKWLMAETLQRCPSQLAGMASLQPSQVCPDAYSRAMHACPRGHTVPLKPGLACTSGSNDDLQGKGPYSYIGIDPMDYVKTMNAPECSASALVQWRTES